MNAGATFGTSLGKQGSTDTVQFALSGASTYNGNAIFPGNVQITLSGRNDTLDFTGSNSTLTIIGTNGNPTLTLSAGSVDVTVGQNSVVAQTGNGNNTITSTIQGLTLDLGTGSNFVGSVAIGTIVNAQSSGVNQFVPSADELITGSTPQDQIVAGNNVLHGAVGEVGSQDPWVVAPNQVKYGFNQQGDLVIQTPYEAAFNNGMTFIQGYVGGPGVPYADQTDGILVSLAQITSSLLIDLTRPFIEDIPDWFKLGNELYFTATGKTIFNADPLVFDLTGAGINLTSLSSASPMLDMEDTGFAMHTGWMAPNDGVLVLEQQGQNGTPNVTEMFGNTSGGTSGFAALAQYDVNGTGVLDASDPIWSQLMVWVDANGNGQVDPGELETMQQAGITSINLDSTAQTNDIDNGNTIAATSTFTFADGSTGNVDQVDLNINTFNTQYLGDTTISASAAAMPNLKGYGTLTDLQVAMTLDPSLIDVVNENLPNLDTENLTSLVQAAMPIFVAWAQAVQLPDANGDLQTVNPADGNTDVPVLMSIDADGNVTVADFAYETKDQAGNTYYQLASGNPVYDQNNNVIAEPTLAQILAQTAPSGETWVDFSGGEIGFIERYYGQPFPIDQASSNPSGAISAMSDLMTGAYTVLDLEAVRLAMQGPLAQYFPGISYDVTTDSFAATTNEQLSPMYEAIFAAAPSDAAGATQWLTNWLPIINIVLGDFARTDGVEVTYGYQFASMVHAYEQTNLPLTIEQVAGALGVPPGEVIEGGSTITGPNSPSIYYLHGGDQTVTAGIGLNNFVMGGTFGQDTIIDDEPEGHSDESVLWFTNVASTDITATRDGLDLTLSVNGTDEQVTVENEFNGVEETFSGGNLADNWGVAQIEFSDGVLWDMPNIAMAVSRPEPNEPTILGTPGMDVLDGGVGGNNFLSGGDGSDIYMFGLGYGHDTISVNRSDPFNDDIDTVAFGAGITMSGLTLSRQGDSDDLSIIVNSTGDTLTILGQFSADYSLFGPLWLNQIEEFAFADGSVYSWQQIDQMMDAAATGTPALYGFDDFNDFLDPGPGVHFLSGGNGVKTYTFDFGYNFDTVQENVTNILADNGDNTIAFNSDVTEQDVTFSLAGNSLGLVITLNDGSTMLIDGEFALSTGSISFNLVQNFQFADGTVYTWNQILQQLISGEEAQSSGVIYGSDYADVLDPGPSGGFHYLSGGDADGSDNGTDTYVFGYGYGSETIDVNWTNLLRRGNEVVSFTAGVSESDVKWSAMGQDLVIQLVGSPTDSATILGQFSPWFYEDGVTSFAFADGTTYSTADIVNMAFNGAGGGATVNVSNAVNLLRSPVTVQSGPGDVFIGDGAVPFTTAGNTFDFNPGDGFNVIVDPEANGIADNINFGAGITESMVQTYLLGTNMIFTFAGSTDQIVWMDNGGYTPNGNVFDAIGSVSFADGTAWSTADLLAGATETPALSIAQNGNNYGVDYNINQGYAYVDLPYEQQGTTTTLYVSGLDPDDVDIQRVGFLDAANNAQAAAILISAVGSTAGGLLVEGPQYSTDLQFDQIVFDNGTVWTKAQVEQMLVDQEAASTGNTEVEGFVGGLTIYAGSGNDVLEGGSASNTYVYQQDDGFAQIVVNKPEGSGYVNTLDLTDIDSTDVTLSRWPGNGINNLVITVDAADGGGQITIENQFGYGSNQADAAISEINFADGVSWNEQDIESQLIGQEEAQTGPEDVIYGFGGPGTLSAVAGVSTLVGGGTNNDNFSWSAGDGATWVTNEGNSDNYYAVPGATLYIHGIDPSDLTVTRDPTPGDYNLVLTSTGQSPIILEGQTGSGSKSVISQVVFDDGTTWNEIDLLIQADGGIATAPNGTNAFSFAGAAANSTMTGTSGDDVFFWGAGDGDDTIVEDPYISVWQKANTLSLVGLNPGDVTLNIVEDGTQDLLITDKATGETMTVVGQFSSASNNGNGGWPGGDAGIAVLQFADGTLWYPQQILDNSAYIAAPGATTLGNENLGNGTIAMEASPGVQFLYGREHVDNTYIWSPGDGSDTIYTGGYGGYDTLRLTNVSESNIQLIRSGGALVVSDTASGENITVPFFFPDQTTDNIDQIVFDDGTVWNSAYINANAEIIAGTGDNTIYGPSDPVIFNLLAAGDDYVNGGGYGDTFLDGPNSGNDTINESGPAGVVNTLRMEGIDPSQVTLGRWNNDLYVERLDNGTTVLVLNEYSSSQPNSGVEQIVFDDGTVWNQATIDAAGPPTFTWVGTASNTTLVGSSFGNNAFDLGPGGDSVTFGSGTNTIEFGKGDGQVQVNFNGTTGTVQMASDISDNDVYLQADNNGDLFIDLRDSSDSITVDNALQQHWWGTSSQITQITFADGMVMSLSPPTLTEIGTASDTTLNGSSYGNNAFDLGPGGDTVNFNNNGYNTIVFDKGDGQVQVNLNGASGAVQIAADIADNDVILQADNNGDLTVALRDDTSDSITIDGDLSSHFWGISSGIQQITFADGTVQLVGQIEGGPGAPLTFTWIGTATDTTLTGSDFGTNVFDLGAGGDTITFGNGNQGGSGNNIIAFDKGDGQVHVNLNGGVGIVQVAADIADSDVILQADNNGDLTIALKDDASDSITVAGDLSSHFWGISSGIQQIVFADGSVQLVGQIEGGPGAPLTFTWVGTASDTALTGSDFGTNVFDLGPGGDTVTFGNGNQGGSGNNIIAFDKGDGQVHVSLNGGAGIIQIAADIADDDVILQADNSGDLTIALKDDASDSITVAGDLSSHFWGISSGIQQIVFADGTVQLVGQIEGGPGAPLTFTWVGTASDTTMAGSDFGTNVFDLGPGGDTITFGNSNQGGSGNNIIAFDKGDGHVEVNLNGGVGAVQIAADIADDDVILQADNNGDLTIALKDDASDSITIAGDLSSHFWGISSGIQQISFADGTTQSVGQIEGEPGGPPTFTWVGTASDTTLTGSSYGNNVYDLGPGGDTVNFSNSGGNTIVFDKGDGQAQVNLNGANGIVEVAADIADNDVILQADNSGDLTIALLDDSSDSITVYNDLHQNWWGISSGIQQIVFADGTTLSVGQIEGEPGGPPTFTWVGTASNTTLTGSSYGNNVYDLGPGGDTVNFSNSGSNTILFDKGDGQVQVNLDGGTGVVQMAADIGDNDVILQADNNGDLTIALLDDRSDSITIANDLHQNWWGISSSVQQIDFADGTTLSVGQIEGEPGGPPTFTWVGTASDTTLTGSSYGSNVYDLGPGGDTVNFSNSGSNTILFDKGEGQVQVNLDGSTGNVQMAADIADNDVSLQADNNGDLTIALLDDGSDSITVYNDLHQNWWGISSSIQQIDFADGTTLTIGQPGYGQGQPLTFTWVGSASNPALTGSSYGNNTFDLGPGAETVTFADNGGNTILFDRGEQALVTLNGGTGSVQMAVDISESDVYLQADNNGDLLIALRNDSSDGIVVLNDLSQNWYGISSQITEITFADGSIMAIGSPGYNNNPPPTFTWFATGNDQTLTGSTFGNNVFELSGSNDVAIGGSGPDILNSSGVHNTLIAGTGANTLTSTGADDTLVGNANGSTLNGSGGVGTVAAYALNNATVNLTTGTAMVYSWVSDTLIGIGAAEALGSNDTLIGGTGATTLISDANGNKLEAGSGPTTALYSASNLTVNLATETASISGATTHDVLVGIKSAIVAGANDTIIAGSGADTLVASGNGDRLFGNAAGSTLIGTAGVAAVAAYTASSVTVNLATGTASIHGGSASDVLTGIAAVTVSGKSDTIIAGSGAETLVANGSSDTLFGNAAGSTLQGVAGTVVDYAINNVTVNLATGTATINGSSVSDTLPAVSTAIVSGIGDTLIAGAGAEALSSSGSDNTLVAGSGIDTLSSSGTGDVLESNATGNTLKTTGTLTTASYAVNNVTVNLATGTASIDGGSGGDTLTAIKRAAVTGSNDTIIAGTGTEVLTAGGSDDTLIGSSGTDTFISNAAGNLLQAGTGAATASYAANGLTVNIATGTAIINGASVGDTLIGIKHVVVTGNDDTLITDGTTDTLTAIGNEDTLIGGGSVSTLSATGSGDTLMGGSAATTLISNAGGNTLEAGSGKAIASYNANNLTVNLATGTVGLNGGGVSDTLVGIIDVGVTGSGDTLIADGGSDTLSITGNNNTLIAGSGTDTLTASGTGNTLEGGSGTSTLISNAAGNTLIAGSGPTLVQYSAANLVVNLAAGTAAVAGATASDTLVGIVDVTVSGAGAVVTGGAGADTLTAKGANDTLIGGSGADTLTTTSSNDLLEGGSGTATLISNDNNNTLTAGTGQTIADYSLSNLTVNLATGFASHGTTSDMLVGIDDVLVTGSTDTLIAGSAFDTLTVSGSTDTLTAANAGDDVLQVTSGSNDTLIATVGGNVLDGDSSHTTMVYTGNGLTIDLATGMAQVNGTSVTDSLSGINNLVVTGNNDTLIADGGSDTLSITGSNDTLVGGSGADTLSAIGSNDTLIGGASTGTLSAVGSGDVLIGGGGTTTLIGTAAGDTLESGTGKAIVTYAANAVAINLATGTAAVNGGSTSDTLVGITDVVASGNNDTLTAGSGSDTLTATGNGSTLIAGAGADRLADSGAGGFYEFASGDGNTTVVNGASGNTGPSNELQFTGSITDENLWLVQSGNNLQIDLMGTKTHVTVSGWFTSSGNDLQEVTAGGLEIDSQLSQLVQAMATYSTAHSSFNPTSTSNSSAPNDPTLQAAIAAAWHH